MLTMLELSKKTKKPYTTVKDYKRRFSEFFIDKVVAGKRYPMLTDTALEVMQDILLLYKDGKDTEEIREELRGKYPTTAEPIKDDDHKHSDDGVTATTTSLDIYTRQQVGLFQAVQQQVMAVSKVLHQVSKIIDQNDELIRQNKELVNLLTNKANKRHTMGSMETIDRVRHKRKNKPVKGNTRTQNRRKKVGWFSKVFG